MDDATGQKIRNELRGYLQFARMPFVQMQNDILPSSDYVIEGTADIETIVKNIVNLIK